MTGHRENPVEYPVPTPIRRRWSPVSYSPEPLDPATLGPIFESARWAASSFNEQPWRFLLARREDESGYATALECLIEANREWARHASALVLVCASESFARNGQANAHAWFDTGQAVAHLVLAAVDQGLYCRTMGGFSHELAREQFEIPEGVSPICMIAIGKLADGSLLEEDTASRDRSERPREPLSGFVFEHRFGEPAAFTKGRGTDD